MLELFTTGTIEVAGSVDVEPGVLPLDVIVVVP
jgi:hypothetical protein